MKRLSNHLFDGINEAEAELFFHYLYSIPGNPEKEPSLRPRIISLYDPFADRKTFPAGIRYCINVYTGCNHHCKYCYVVNYIRDPKLGRTKVHFKEKLIKDIEQIKAHELPPKPLHISNSTDPLQGCLEKMHRHTFYVLETLVRYAQRFSTITILTKNPEMLLDPECDYLGIIRSLPNLQIEVSLIYWDDDKRQVFEPGAPSVDSRMRGIVGLRKAGVRVSLRIDPLMPRNPLPEEIFKGKRLADYGVLEAHSLKDIKCLIDFACDTGCQKIIHSAQKVPFGRYHDAAFKKMFEELYARLNNGINPIKRSFAFRLPDEYYRKCLLGPIHEYCAEKGIPHVECKTNLITTE